MIFYWLVTLHRSRWVCITSTWNNIRYSFQNCVSWTVIAWQSPSQIQMQINTYLQQLSWILHTPCHLLLNFPYKTRKVGGHVNICVLGVSILSRNYSDLWYFFVFHCIADFSDLLELRKITQINDMFLSSCVPRKLLMTLMDAIFFIVNQKNLKKFVPY